VELICIKARRLIGLLTILCCTVGRENTMPTRRDNGRARELGGSWKITQMTPLVFERIERDAI